MKSFRQFLIENSNIDLVRKRYYNNNLTTENFVSRAEGDSEMQRHLANEHKAAGYIHLANPDVASLMINKLSEGDPSKDKKHIGQITDWYSKGHFRAEDLPSVHDTLTHFQDVKNKDKLPDIPNPKQPGEVMKGTRIKSYSHMSWQEFRAHVRKHLNLGREHEKEFSHPDAPVVFDKDGTKVHELQSKDASIHLGKCINTEWCTTWNNNSNMHDYYASKGPLYYVHGKDGEHYQIHPRFSQYMDTEDIPVRPQMLANKYPELKQFQPFKHIKVEKEYPFLTDHEKDHLFNEHINSGFSGNLETQLDKMEDIIHGGTKEHLLKLRDFTNAKLASNLPSTVEYPYKKVNDIVHMKLSTEHGIHENISDHPNPGSMLHLSHLIDQHQKAIRSTNTDYSGFNKHTLNYPGDIHVQVNNYAFNKLRDVQQEFGKHFGHMIPDEIKGYNNKSAFRSLYNEPDVSGVNELERHRQVTKGHNIGMLHSRAVAFFDHYYDKHNIPAEQRDYKAIPKNDKS